MQAGASPAISVFCHINSKIAFREYINSVKLINTLTRKKTVLCYLHTSPRASWQWNEFTAKLPVGERSAYSILYSTNDKNFNVNFNLFVGLLINKCFETTQYSAFSLACTLNFRGKITAERNFKTGLPVTDTHFDCLMVKDAMWWWWCWWWWCYSRTVQKTKMFKCGQNQHSIAHQETWDTITSTHYRVNSILVWRFSLSAGL